MQTATKPRRKEINWNASKDEIVVIRKIAARAFELAKKQSFEIDQISMQMDITACHLNGNPLDLDKFLHADDFNFSHDAFGIRRHLSRETGQLVNCFLPRCSKREG